MRVYGDKYLEFGNIKTPYQVKREGEIMDFLNSQEDKKLASIIRMHQADGKDFTKFWESL